MFRKIIFTLLAITYLDAGMIGETKSRNDVIVTQVQNHTNYKVYLKNNTALIQTLLDIRNLGQVVTVNPHKTVNIQNQNTLAIKGFVIPQPAGPAYPIKYPGHFLGVQIEKSGNPLYRIVQGKRIGNMFEKVWLISPKTIGRDASILHTPKSFDPLKLTYETAILHIREVEEGRVFKKKKIKLSLEITN